MGKLRFVALCFGLAACGSDKATPVDAAIDTPKTPDAKVWMDAPPGPTYDLSCFGTAAPTTVDATITVAGATQSLGMGGATAVGNVEVSVYKVGSDTASATVTSADTGTVGAFMTDPITTNGTALEFLKGLDLASTPTYRTTYLYPNYPVRSSVTDVPVLMVPDSLLDQLQQIPGLPMQDDSTSGMFVVLVNDCGATPQGITGATVTVKQNDQSVGAVLDLGSLVSQAAGTYFVLNVPDGPAELTVKFQNKTFPAKTLVAHKKPSDANAMGTVTLTQVTPGYVN